MVVGTTAATAVTTGAITNMSYQRDRDAYTRGSGAIAASDYGNARRARERRAKLARFEREDRMLSQFTMGARGGMGAIDQVKLGVTGRPTLSEGGNVESPNRPEVGSGRVPMPTPQQPTGGPNGFPYRGVIGGQVQYGVAVAPVDPPRVWIDPVRPGVVVDPVTGTPVTSSPASTGLSSSTKKWLLIAALAAGGAYLYSRNKRGGGG